MTDYILLLIGYVFTFLVPGFYLLGTFFPSLPTRIKVPLVPILSVLVSTYLVYFVSLVLGFSRYTVLVSFSFFLPWLIADFREIVATLKSFVCKHHWGVAVSLIVFAVYLVALYPGIFTEHEGYVVMSSSNWQDTAMHMGIIESISQGNFPPQAPYFSGVPLNYYYFADFHTSILEALFGRFFPRILVYDNPFFATALVLAVYSLAFEITKNKKVSVFSAGLSAFIGNYMFINFFKDLVAKVGTPLWLIGNRGYAIDFGNLFQISPMSDYFLQNRPMMVGIPAVVFVFLLSIYSFRKRKAEAAILAGAISGMLVKFQFFASGVALGIFFLTATFYFNPKNLKFLVKSVLLFLAPYVIPLIIFIPGSAINGTSILKVFIENFSFGPWERGKSVSWFLNFICFNLGLPFFITLIALFIKKSRALLVVILIALGLSLLPFISRFTIMKYDMLKFFYFSEIFFVIVTFWALNKFFRNKYLFVVLSLIVITTSSFTSVLNLGNSFLNKTIAYTLNEVDSGYWIRENTPRLSKFIDLANVHSPITEVGGRLRVLSYINWPHSHGYNVGPDNVFSRLEDIKNLYSKNDLSAASKYNAGYIYYGRSERDEYPQAEKDLENSQYLSKVFDNGEVKIFKMR